MIHPYQLAKLCEITYELTKDSKIVNFENFYLSKVKDSLSGLFVASYLREEDKTMVISFRGTDFNFKKDYGLAETLLDTIGSNLPILFGGFSNKVKNSINSILPADWQSEEFFERMEPLQLDGAIRFTKNQIDSNPDYNVIITGHSLGGFLGQAVGVQFGLQTIVFDTPGAGNYLKNHFGNYKKSQITIYNSFPNIINALHAHAVKPYLVDVETFVEGIDFQDYVAFSMEQHKISKISESLKLDKIYQPEKKWPSTPLSGYCAFAEKHITALKDLSDFPFLTYSMCLGTDSFNVVKIDEIG
jgi:hypothetical protein